MSLVSAPSSTSPQRSGGGCHPSGSHSEAPALCSDWRWSCSRCCRRCGTALRTGRCLLGRRLWETQVQTVQSLAAWPRCVLPALARNRTRQPLRVTWSSRYPLGWCRCSVRCWHAAWLSRNAQQQRGRRRVTKCGRGAGTVGCKVVLKQHATEQTQNEKMPILGPHRLATWSVYTSGCIMQCLRSLAQMFDLRSKEQKLCKATAPTAGTCL